MNAAAPPKVLVADDDASIRLVLSHAFSRAGFQVRATGAALTLLKWAAEGEGDVVVTDVVMPDANVFDVLPRLRQARPRLPVVVMSAQTTLLTAVAAAERGAFEYMPKPFDLDEMVAAVRRALQPGEGAAPARLTRDADLPLIGRSTAMQGVYRSVARLVGGDEPVLLHGPTGSGKSLAARVLHDLGPRRAGPLRVAAVAGLSGAELEARLAGGEGAFARAAGGTVVLDGADHLAPDAQARLAGLLDRLEAEQEAAVRPRVLSTTVADPWSRGTGALEGPLLHRLAVATLRLPPLRERPEDVGELAAAFLQRERPGGEAPRLEPAAVRRLERHGWPGNVRELHNLLRRLTRRHTGARLGVELVDAELAPAAAPSDEGEAAVERKLAEAVDLLFAGAPPPPGVHERLVAALERPLLRAALTAGGGAQLRAAEILGLNRNTLRKRLQDLGLKA